MRTTLLMNKIIGGQAKLYKLVSRVYVMPPLNEFDSLMAEPDKKKVENELVRIVRKFEKAPEDINDWITSSSKDFESDAKKIVEQLDKDTEEFEKRLGEKDASLKADMDKQNEIIKSMDEDDCGL